MTPAKNSLSSLNLGCLTKKFPSRVALDILFQVPIQKEAYVIGKRFVDL